MVYSSPEIIKVKARKEFDLLTLKCEVKAQELLEILRQ